MNHGGSCIRRSDYRLRVGAATLVLGALMSGCAPGGDSAEILAIDSRLINQPGLQLSVSTAQQEFQSGEAIPVHVSVHNTSVESLSFLPINTAFEEQLQADVFDVIYAGRSTAYIGIVARRLPIVAADILSLDPDERLDKVVDISQHYQMDMPGEYTIRYNPVQLIVEPELQNKLADLSYQAEDIVIVIR